MEHRKSFSLFGPLLLIAAGTIWLLVKAGTIPSANLWALTYIWPYFLIAAGVGLMLKAIWKYASLVMDVIIIGGLVLAIIYAPKLGWTNPSAMFHFAENGDVFMGPGMKGSGNITTETRKVSGVDSIDLEYPAVVTIEQGETESVKIEADDNLLPDIQTQMKGNTLDIFYKRTNNTHVIPTKPVLITIVVKELKDVEFSSAGELKINELKSDDLSVDLNGAGNLDLNEVNLKKLSVNLSGAGSMKASGTADELEVRISGFGDFKGADLHSKTVSASISGAGSATVWADEKLDAAISGAGSVNYYGSPSVTQRVSGVGNVSQQGNK
jgi:hypothetical protein